MINKFFTFMLVLSITICLFTSIKAAKGYMLYFLLSAQETALIDAWTIEKKDDANFAIQIHYHFFVAGKKVEGATELTKPFYPSKPLAEKAIISLQKQSWNVFFSKDRIEKNSLQRKFPFQECIHSFLALGVVIYFFCLKNSTKKLTI
jgi:hypothetical protein